ncbi:hypothetical protein FOA43_002731 [Brettanomyces nanus]|uniref:Palmitoyltransferase n=1 Tax=Eeniella nana TaxID=13502 RepID=A0A875S349_EENNA|nr:uncharacterized protein FOA43_002731 [Brettanomyces nanus]QPG75378.1 hypothetical protein FOA43_002731 [Brettanomyces nanus]
MAVSFKWPWLGVAVSEIPTVIIAYVHIITSWLIIRDDDSSRALFWMFNFSVFMVWLSYYLAIMTLPGSPPSKYRSNDAEKPITFWYKYCRKCRAEKPERCHHCKTCGRCILKMDHHCPWTMNCVGFRNLPHFTRFLMWLLIACFMTLKYYGSRLWSYYKMRNLPFYLISRTEMVLVIVNFIVVAFVEFTLALLFMRTINGLISNVTTIEDWEQDRMHHVFFRDAFWDKVRKNYNDVHGGKPFPELTSWKINYRELPHNSSVPASFSFEDWVFPYDLGSGYENMVQSLGPLYLWLWPWGGPGDNGLKFEKTWWKKEDQLHLPFPMDGDNYKGEEKVEVDLHGGETIMGNFPNELGETLEDFGVDMATENYEIKKVM